MYKKEFEQLKNPPRSIMFFGDDEYFIDTNIKKIIDTKPEALVQRQYFDLDFKQAKEHLQSNSLFWGSNILIIKTDKKIDSKELKELILTANASKDNVFILEYQASDAKTKSNAFAKNGGVFVRLFRPNQAEAINELAKIAKQMGLDLEQRVIVKLAHEHACNISLAIKDLEKLSLHETLSTTEAIAMISSDAEAGNMDLIDALIRGKDIMEISQKLLLEQESEIAIILSLNNLFHTLFNFSLSLDLEYSANSAQLLGYKLPFQIEQNYSSLAQKIGTRQFFYIFEFLSKTELALKSETRIEKRAFFFSQLIKLQALF